MVRNGRKISIIAITLLLVVCICGPPVYASQELDPLGFRENNARIFLPESWYLEEVGSLSEDEEVLKDGTSEYTTEIAEFFDADGTSTGDLYMVYQEDPAFTAEAFASVIGAKDYYEEEGREFLKEFLRDRSGKYRLDEGVRLIGASGESGNCMICATAAMEKELRIYLIKNTDHLLGILSFYGKDGRMPDETLTDRIAGSLSWEDYDLGLYERTYTRDDVEWAEDEEDEGIDISLILPIFLTFVAIMVAINGKGENDGTKRIERMKEHLPGQNIGKTEVGKERPARPSQMKSMRRKEASQFDRLPDTPHKKRVHQHPDGEFEPGHGEKRVHQHPDGTRETAHYSGYRESLKTLYKSGLVTRQELRELIEKHKNDL